MIELRKLWRNYMMYTLSENVKKRAEANKMLDKYKLKFRDMYSKYMNQRRFI